MRKTEITEMALYRIIIMMINLKSYAFVPQLVETGRSQKPLQVNDHIVGAHPTGGTMSNKSTNLHVVLLG